MRDESAVRSRGQARHIVQEHGPRSRSGRSSTHRSKRRRSKDPLHRFRRFANKHTWTVPLLLLVAFGVAYTFNPTESNIVHRFIFLSYKVAPADGASLGLAQYGKGPRDFTFVAFYAIVLTFTREFIMQEILRPLARRGGIATRGKQLRFMEQAYTAIYFSFTGPLGLYVMSRTPVWYFDTRGMYEAYPHRTLDGAFKFYYLFEAAYWVQQAMVMVLGQEKRRKDFKELVAHHIVTISLIWLSYRFHFTHIGVAVYITHDVSDVFLAISKSLHYLESRFIGPVYTLNIGVWIYLRHYLNIRILYSLLTEFRTVGPYELNWETEQYKCWISNVVTFVLLALLQALNLFWLYCLLRSAYRFVVHNIAKDDRSEDEDEEGEMEKRQNEL
ncbi:uncharacterized protein E0L32_010879 [Thyridium curvatum]|uniref:TLC domain-containing protein n=1 Tax=Thyridium curvatum TaxID=1093900 RepID=A0A507AL75_9PEZI|nr:uncharacterized protein E0L32_010879 [Thyridium curvatum]TPX07176.1 hypothetical protein E0L32_010879 [Thyridium curvatum]